jgi:aspartate/methionine/tyrosine aminotransferase
MRSPAPFQFMHWAKTWVGQVPYCMGASGVREASPEEFDFEAPDLVGTTNYFGVPALRSAIAAMHGVGIDHVLASDGASLATYTALAVVAGPGDRVLVESPTYPVLAQIPHFHGVETERIARRAEDAWQPRLDEIRAEVERRGKPVAAIVLTRLHNPSFTDLDAAFLNDLARLAEEKRFVVLLDEVYLDFVEGATPGHRLSRRFISTGSLTKVYGFGPLRVGWVIAAPEILRPIQEFSFYLQVDGAHPMQQLGARIIAARERVLARSRGIASRGRAIFEEWMRGRGDVSWVPSAGGVAGFVHFERLRETAELAALLRERDGVNIAEGEFFGHPGWARISFGGEEENLREALRRLGRALDEAAGGEWAA